MHIVELIIDLMLQLKIGNHFRSAVTLQGPFADVKEVAQVLVVQQMFTLFLMRSMQFLINLILCTINSNSLSCLLRCSEMSRIISKSLVS